MTDQENASLLTNILRELERMMGVDAEFYGVVSTDSLVCRTPEYGFPVFRTSSGHVFAVSDGLLSDIKNIALGRHDEYRKKLVAQVSATMNPPDREISIEQFEKEVWEHIRRVTWPYAPRSI